MFIYQDGFAVASIVVVLPKKSVLVLRNLVKNLFAKQFIFVSERMFKTYMHCEHEYDFLVQCSKEWKFRESDDCWTWHTMMDMGSKIIRHKHACEAIMCHESVCLRSYLLGIIPHVIMSFLPFNCSKFHKYLILYEDGR